MATWRSAGNKPVTVEREVRVVDDSGREGYVLLVWEGKGHNPRFHGPVFTKERHYDGSGSEVDPPTETVLDNKPTFA